MKYLFLLLLVVACSSAKKDAQELSDKGQYEQAVLKWLEAYKKDPNDEEVINGLKEAQDHVVNDRLVRVRNLRNTKNYLEALTELKQLVEIETAWAYKLDFNSANFQGQETTTLWQYQKERLSFLIQKKQPLAAAFYFEDYKHVFSHIKAEELKTELSKIKSAGKAPCQELLQASEAQPYSRSFANQFCSYFSPRKSLSVNYKPFLYSGLDGSYQINGINNELMGILSNEAYRALTETPWFLAGGSRKLDLNTTGKYEWKSTSEIVPLVHSYIVQAPYTVWEKVKRETIVNGVKKDYYDNIKVTKYRKETHTYPYYGTKKSQKFTIFVNGKSPYGQFNFSKEDQEEVIIHNTSIPEIGLAPKTADLNPQTEQFKIYSTQVAEKFKESLMSGWENTFCVMPENRSSFAISENALKCRKIKTPKAISFANNWFENNYGISNEAAEKVLGDF